MFFKEDNAAKFLWRDYVLVQPAISVGGVGQLTIDLILNNVSDAERIGFLYNRCFLPTAGSDPFGGKSQTICTGCEVFLSKSQKLVIIQQRSPFIKGRIPSFRKQLVEWVKQCQFRKVIILGSCSAHIQNDMDLKMSTQSVMYLSSKDHQLLEESFTADLKWLKFIHTRTSLESPDAGNELFIPGGGITKTLFEDCCQNEISVIALLVFSSNGSRTPDAFKVADAFNSLLPLISTAKPFKSESWKIPVSWVGALSTAALPQMY